MEKAILRLTAHVGNCAERNVLMALYAESLTKNSFMKKAQLLCKLPFFQDSSKTILPVISGFMKGKEASLMETNVFYDTGAQISLIRSACAEQLGLDHKPVKIVITKVGGVEEEPDTKMYKVPLYDDSGKSIQTIQAVGISHISEDSVGVNISRISRILEMPASKLHRKEGPIDLLIGIN